MAAPLRLSLGALLAIACAPRARGPAATIPDLHAHAYPITLSSRVAIDETPCLGGSLRPAGELEAGALGATDLPSPTLRGELAGRVGDAAPPTDAAVRAAAVTVVLWHPRQPPSDPGMRASRRGDLPGDSACRADGTPLSPGDTLPQLLLNTRPPCYVPMSGAVHRVELSVAGEAVRADPDAAGRCGRGRRP